MKKAIWISALVAFVFAFASCSKKDDAKPTPGGGTDNPGGGGQNPPPASSNYVKTKIDGTQKSFGTAEASKEIDNESGIHELDIIGYVNSNKSGEAIILSMQKGGADITPGEYTEGDHDDYFVYGVYLPTGDNTNVWVSGAQLLPESPFKITVTEVTSTHVKGTFSGTFFDNGGEGNNKKIFTEGTFDAPLQ